MQFVQWTAINKTHTRYNVKGDTTLSFISSRSRYVIYLVLLFQKIISVWYWLSFRIKTNKPLKANEIHLPWELIWPHIRHQHSDTICQAQTCHTAFHDSSLRQNVLNVPLRFLFTIKHVLCPLLTLAARMDIIATAILCMFWSSWLHSHCITNLAASNLKSTNTPVT